VKVKKKKGYKEKAAQTQNKRFRVLLRNKTIQNGTVEKELQRTQGPRESLVQLREVANFGEWVYFIYKSPQKKSIFGGVSLKTLPGTNRKPF